MVSSEGFNKDTPGVPFLSGLDKYLEDNWEKLTCNDIADIYFDFGRDLKTYRGTSTNFVGLSELIVFRFLVHQLGGMFIPKWGIPNNNQKTPDTCDVETDTAEFTNGKFILQQGFKLKPTKYRPDIAIWNSDKTKLIGIIQIKAYLTYGTKTFDDEMKIFEEIKKEYRYAYGQLMLIYNTCSKHKPLGKESPDTPHFKYLKEEAEGESEMFCKVLRDGIPGLP